MQSLREELSHKRGLIQYTGHVAGYNGSRNAASEKNPDGCANIERPISRSQFSNVGWNRRHHGRSDGERAARREGIQSGKGDECRIGSYDEPRVQGARALRLTLYRWR